MDRLNAIGWTEIARVPGLSPCWEWNGALSPTGYARIATGGRQGSTYVHRLTLAEALGRELHSGMLACHHCDNRKCVNPAHLYEGTREDNTRDAVLRGGYRRGARVKAMAHLGGQR